MKKNCPQRCDLCYGETTWGPWRRCARFWSGRTTTVTLISCLPEPLDAVATPTPPPANVKIKMVPRGKVVGFRCGTKNPRSPPKVRSADQALIFSLHRQGRGLGNQSSVPNQGLSLLSLCQLV